MSGSKARAAAAGPDKKPPPGAGAGLGRPRGRRGSGDAASRAGVPCTEAELLALETVRPEHVLALSRVTDRECGRARRAGGRRGSVQASSRGLGRSPAPGGEARPGTDPALRPGEASPGSPAADATRVGLP